MRNALKEFESEFDKATQVTGDWLLSYSAIYDQARILNKRIQEIEEKNAGNSYRIQCKKRL